MSESIEIDEKSKAIIEIVKKNEGARLKELSKITGICTPTLRYRLTELALKGRIRLDKKIVNGMLAVRVYTIDCEG